MRIFILYKQRLMIRFLGGLLDRIFAVAGALLFVQLPLFIQQYIQQLVGRTEELKLQLSALQQAAAVSQKTLAQYIQKFLASADADFAMQGEFMQSIVHRWERLSEALFSLQHCSSVEKPFIFFSVYSHQVASSTFHHFSPGLLFTLEGAAYALVGTCAGFLFFKLLRMCMKFVLFSKRKQNPA